MIIIKDLIKWEQLLKIPFSKMDYENEEHLEAMLYVIYIRANKTTAVFPTFKLIDKDCASKRSSLESLANELLFIAQFQPKTEKNEADVEARDEPDIYIEDFVNELLLNGITASYVLDSTPEIIPGLIRALAAKKREAMENERLWTYLSILPHIDSKRVKSPMDIMPFPWEEEEQAKRLEVEKEEALVMAEGFLKA